MKKFIMKLTSLFLAVVVCFGSFAGGFSVSAEETADIAQSNFEFAVKTAEIIKNNENSMLRIIGKLRSEISDFDFPCDSDCVVSEDGRFMLQFSAEKELESCLKFLQNNPDVIYAERDIPVYTGDAEESDPLSWGVEAIEADIYSKAIISEGENSVTVAIVDSGVAEIDFFKDNLVQGYDFFENDSDAFQDTSEDSHGTFLASLAVGGVNEENRFIGAAPDAQIAMVKLKSAKQYLRDFYLIRTDAPCYQENDIMLGIEYLDRLAARENLPLVICIALGTNRGGHSSLSPLAGQLELYSNISNRIIVIAAGNEANQRHHYQGVLENNNAVEEVEIRVDENVSGFTIF